MRNRRDRRGGNKKVFFITNRVGRGIPFIPARNIKLLMESALAKGQDLYPVQKSGFLWMGNHYHLLISGTGKHVSKYVGYIQSQIAKIIKRLTNIYDIKVWPTRFKEQVLHTGWDVLRKLAYIYLNPARAGLVKSISEYPGLSSYDMLVSGSKSKFVKYIPVRHAKLLGSNPKNYNSVSKYKKLRSLSEETLELKLYPFIWKKFFPSTENVTDEELYKELMDIIEGEEAKVLKTQKTFIGAKRLINAGFSKNYKPKKKDKTPYIICYDKEYRMKLIASYKLFVKNAREAWVRLKNGMKNIKLPTGAFYPSSGFVPIYQLA